MKISVTDGQRTVLFELNDTPAAVSLYHQLPQTLPVDNYGSNEKIFYPPDALDTTDAIEGGGSAGGLAYFSPWGNVVMYYGPFGQYPGLYLLGEAVSGGEQIGQLTGTITVEQVIESSSTEPETSKAGAYRIEETEFRRDGKKIYAQLYLPEQKAASAIVVIAHGFGGNLTQVSAYSRAFAESGIAVCAFDFIGGGRDSRSDGSMTEMSVLTEAADLNAVIDGIMEREDLDFEDIFLLGGSQGSFVASYVAGQRPEDIQGLVALYPAYVLQDIARSCTPDPENLPETMDLMGMTVGRIYNTDAISFDIYDVIANYPGEVLIIHGTNDTIAPISYSERAVEVFPSAELVKIEGAGHGFFGDAETVSARLAVDFVMDHLSKQR